MTGDPYCELHGFIPCNCVELQRFNGDTFVKEFRKTKNMTMNQELDHETLEYRDNVVETLHEAIEEFLEFSTARELMKLISSKL